MVSINDRNILRDLVPKIAAADPHGAAGAVLGSNAISVGDPWSISLNPSCHQRLFKIPADGIPDAVCQRAGNIAQFLRGEFVTDK